MSGKIHVEETEVQGFRALHITNQVLSLTIIPNLGGKISSIRDLRNGREWLWTNTQIPYQRHNYGTSYQEADTGGWDECFPTVSACSYPLPPWKGRSIPDHGEIWPLQWSIRCDGDTEATLIIDMQAQSIGLPYVFQRIIRITVDSPSLRFDYRVVNQSDNDIAFIWSSHPLFAVEPGMRIQLPDNTRMNTWVSMPTQLDPQSGEQAWPIHARLGEHEWDLSYMPDEAAGIGIKLWSQPLAQGFAALIASDGEFRFTFDTAQLPQLGIWMNARGYSGTGSTPYYNLGLEPCIGAQDSLEDAIEKYQRYEILPANGMKEWWLETHLSTS
ncbi:hypothetical protein [Ktedonobacter robiniae]|uniref:Galactose mutarotase n=1 Tax=Ktedonobacter robiniae TaxID=2778365 RepID=A0ABQ3UYT6_9CHLR|nr:hypothetical protein [Ktedonobacter robiniae]GHO57817.1 hypothetical protein KSB_62920 [Ktedonobacter robiniae]